MSLHLALCSTKLLSHHTVCQLLCLLHYSLQLFHRWSGYHWCQSGFVEFSWLAEFHGERLCNSGRGRWGTLIHYSLFLPLLRVWNPVEAVFMSWQFSCSIVDSSEKPALTKWVDKHAACSGVFKGRRARHLPRVPPFWGPPLRYYPHKFSLFLVKDVLFTHVMFYKANYKQVFCFQRPPLQKLKYAGTLLSKGPQQQLKYVCTLLLNFIEGAPKRNCSV